MSDEKHLLDQTRGRSKLLMGKWKYPRTAATLAVVSILVGAYRIATTGYLPGEGLAIIIDFTLGALITFGFWYGVALLVGWTHRKLWQSTNTH